MANLSNINNKFLFTDGDFLKIGNGALINQASSIESGLSITNANVASITLTSTGADGKTFLTYANSVGSYTIYDVGAGEPRLTINTGGTSNFTGDVYILKTLNTAVTSKVTNLNTGSGSQARFVAVSDGGNIQLKSVSIANTTYGAGDAGVINCDTMSGGFRIAHNDVTKYTLAFNGENTWTGGGTFAGTITINGAGTAASGSINLESDDPFIRLEDNGAGSSTDKKKWDIRAIGASGAEQFDIRTINDANTVFSTKLSIAHNGNSTFAGNVNISSPGDLYINSGTSYNNVGSVFMSNQRTEISSIIVDGTAQGDTALNFKTRSAGSTASAMFIDEFRNVGIGAAPGNYKLDVTGGGRFTGFFEMAGGGCVYQAQPFYLDGGGDTFLESPSSNLMTFTVGATERMRIRPNGTVAIGIGNAVNSNVSLRVVNSINSEWIAEFKNTNTAGNTYGLVINTLAGAGTYNLGCYTHSGNGFFVKNNGTVGIGLGTPISTFHLSYSGGSYGTDATSGFINQATTGRATQRIRSIGNNPAELFFDIDGGIAWDISARESPHTLNFYGRGATPGYSSVSGPYVQFFQNGNVTIAGTLTQNSDITLKENIKPLQSQLEIVSRLNPVSYNKIGQDKNEIGFIAQEVEELLPELVLENEEGLKSLAYGNMNAILVKAIQELKAEIEILKNK